MWIVFSIVVFMGLLAIVPGVYLIYILIRDAWQDEVGRQKHNAQAHRPPEA